MSTNPKPDDRDDPLDEVQGPAVVTPLHVRARPATNDDMRPITGTSAWSKLTIIEQCYEHGRLGEKSSNLAKDRYNAGKFYTKLWDLSQKAGRDSTAGFDVGRSMGSGIPLTEAQSDAVARLVAIEMKLGANDRTIVRAVCALGYQPNEAIHGLCKLSSETRVTPRLCEALDALLDAIERTAKSKRR